MRAEQGMVCPQAPSAVPCPTALPSQPLLRGEVGPSSPGLCQLLQPDEEARGDISPATPGSPNSRGRVICGPAPQGTAGVGVRKGRRPAALPSREGCGPQSQTHTARRWGSLGPAACCSSRSGDPPDQCVQAERTMAWKHASSGS